MNDTGCSSSILLRLNMLKGVPVLYNWEWICYRVFQCYTTESEYVTGCSSTIQLRVNMLQGVPVLYNWEWICYMVFQFYTTESECVPGCSSAIQRRVDMLEGGIFYNVFQLFQGVPVLYNLRVDMLQGVTVVYNCECVTGCSWCERAAWLAATSSPTPQGASSSIHKSCRSVYIYHLNVHRSHYMNCTLKHLLLL
jgi:hypothetical protein